MSSPSEPAFPAMDHVNLCERSDRHGDISSSVGLTKRELFAAMAMQGYVANASLTEMLGSARPTCGPVKWYAERAVVQADVLLAELAKEKSCSE